MTLQRDGAEGEPMKGTEHDWSVVALEGCAGVLRVWQRSWPAQGGHLGLAVWMDASTLSWEWEVTHVDSNRSKAGGAASSLIEAGQAAEVAAADIFRRCQRSVVAGVPAVLVRSGCPQEVPMPGRARTDPASASSKPQDTVLPPSGRT